MKAIIVAAGSGSRLGKLAKDTPKSLLDVNGQSILERQISVFKKLGISDITVIIGPHAEKFTFKNISFIQDKNYLAKYINSPETSFFKKGSNLYNLDTINLVNSDLTISSVPNSKVSIPISLLSLLSKILKILPNPPR